jgi:hypothetical protein
LTTEQEKLEYLIEHIWYERWMLDHSLSRMGSVTDQFDWNAFFVSFAVHARNLYKFLTNRDGSNVKARDYVADFKHGSHEFSIAKWDQAVLHLAKARPSEADRKVDYDDAIVAHRWATKEFSRFLDMLGEPYKSSWEQRATKEAQCFTIRYNLPVHSMSSSSSSVSSSSAIQLLFGGAASKVPPRAPEG